MSNLEHFHGYGHNRYNRYRGGYPWYNPYYTQPVVIQQQQKPSIGDYQNLIDSQQPVSMSGSCLCFLLLVIMMFMAYNKKN